MKECTGLGRGKGGGKRCEEGWREKKRCVCVCVCVCGWEGEGRRECEGSVREKRKGREGR